MWHWGRGGTVKRQEARLQPCLPLSPHRGINCMAGEVTGGGGRGHNQDQESSIATLSILEFTGALTVQQQGKSLTLGGGGGGRRGTVKMQEVRSRPCPPLRPQGHELCSQGSYYGEKEVGGGGGGHSQDGGS